MSVRSIAILALALSTIVANSCGGDSEDSAGSSPTRAPSTISAPPTTVDPDATPIAPRGAEIAPAPCDSDAISISGDTAALVTFVNQTNERVLIDWVNYEGNLVRYKELAAGASYAQPTWITHPWIVSRADGACIATYTAIEEEGVVTIR